jgi:hypothetical protein
VLANARADLLAEAAAGIGLKYVSEGMGQFEGMTVYSDFENPYSSRAHTFIAHKAGAPVTINTYGDAQAVQTRLTQAYSKAAVNWAAKKNGWTVQAQTAPNKFTLTRR